MQPKQTTVLAVALATLVVGVALALSHYSLGPAGLGLPTRPELILELERKGVELLEEGHAEEAIIEFGKALGYAKQSNRSDTVARMIRRLADAYQSQGQLTMAEVQVKKAVAVSAVGDDRPGLLAAYRHLASVYMQQEDPVRAEDALRRALAVAEQQGDSHAMAESCIALAEVLELMGRDPEAGELYRRAATLHDSAGDPEAARQTRARLDRLGADT
ncbi:MAG: tetratricopeptide repeat protein [Nitrospirota bacterium]|nr:tetratricopeptide repeat protein [Nitrospirota bacterium]